MSEWLLPVGVSLAAVVLTYLFCVRPMRRGHCHGSSRAGSPAPGADRDQADLDRALDAARNDLGALLARRSPDPERGSGMRSVTRGTPTEAVQHH